MMDNDTNRAVVWAAGLFEGEGSIAIAKYRRQFVGGEGRGYMLNVTLRMTDEQCVEAFHDALGLGHLHYIGRQVPWRPVWGWTASNKIALKALQAMRPYFRSDRVRTKADLAIEFQFSRRIGRPARDSLHKAVQAEMYERMRVLNLRGVAAIERDEGLI